MAAALLAAAAVAHVCAQDVHPAPPAAATAVRLKDLLPLDKYQSFRTRIQAVSQNSMELVLAIDRFRPQDRLVLVQGGQQQGIAVADNGELLIAGLEKVLRADDAALLLPGKGADAPKVFPRVKIKLPLNLAQSRQQLVTVVRQYEAAAKSLEGWTSFFAPSLDCLAMEYPAQERGAAVAVLDSGTPAARELKASQRGRVFIDLSQAFDTLTLLKEPQWAWGCSYARWRGEAAVQ